MSWGIVAMPGFRKPLLSVLICLLAALPGSAQQPKVAAAEPVRERGPLIAIEHVTIIDGTGAAPRANQTLVIDHGRISALGADGSVPVPAGAREIDGRGKTIIPGLVGMHE